MKRIDFDLFKEQVKKGWHSITVEYSIDVKIKKILIVYENIKKHLNIL